MRISGCRLKEKTQDRLAELFVGGVTARSAADLARVNRKTAVYFFHRLRQIIAGNWRIACRSKGLSKSMRAILAAFARASAGAAQPARPRSSAILKRGGKVHTVMIPDVRKDTLLPIIRQKVVPDSIV
jgi:transposase